MTTLDAASAPPAAQPIRDLHRYAAISIITLVAFATGAVGLVYEYLLATTATYILGNSMEQYAVTIALMMGMMGVGGWVQQFVPDTKVLVTFVMAEFILGVAGGFAPMANVAAYTHATDHYALVQYAFIVGIGLLIGIEIPLAARLQERYIRQLKTNLAGITGADYIGALAGAFVWIQLLHMGMDITRMGFIVAAINLAVAVITLAYFAYRGLMPSRRSRIVSCLIGIVSILLVVFGYVQAPAWSAQTLQGLYDDPIVYSSVTPYQQLVVTQRELSARPSGQTDTRLWINGNIQFSSVDEPMYHEPLVHPIMSLTNHRRVLILGGGDGMALREVLKYPDVQSVTLVDLDPRMVELASTNPIFTKLNQGAFQDARVHTRLGEAAGVTSTGETTQVYHATGDTYELKHNQLDEVVATAEVDVYTIDAAKFVEAAPGKFDTVIIDLVDPSSIDVAKLYSQQFYGGADQFHGVAQLLAPGGMMVVQSGSPFHANAAFNCVVNTIKAAGFNVLPYHTNVPSFGDWGWTLAWPSSEPASDLINRLVQTGWQVPTVFLDSPQTFVSMLAFGKNQLDPRVPISTLVQPRIVDFYTRDAWAVD